MIASAAKVSLPRSTVSRRSSVVVTVVVCLIVSIAIAVMLRVDPKKPTRDPVLRVLSPDANVSAIVYELSGDAKSSFKYQVEVSADGRKQNVAELSGAMRNDRAYGIDLQWLNDKELSIEYLTAQQQKLLVPDVTIAGRTVHLTLHSGVRDNDAPPGGMLFNLRQP